MRRQATQPLLRFWECRQGCLVITGTYPLAGRSDPDLAADKAYRNTSVKYSQAHNTWTLHLRNTYIHTFMEHLSVTMLHRCLVFHVHLNIHIIFRANSHQRHTLHLTKWYPRQPVAALLACLYPRHTCSCTPHMPVHTYIPTCLHTYYVLVAVRVTRA